MTGLSGLVGESAGGLATSNFRVNLGCAKGPRGGPDEAEILRLVSGVLFTKGSRPIDGVLGVAFAVPGGDTAWPRTPPRDGRPFGVREATVLLSDKGRSFGVAWEFCNEDSGCFLIVDAGRDATDVLTGVPVGVDTLALRLRFPGVVMGTLPDRLPNLFGVAGVVYFGPSLVEGRLLFDMADAGRKGGGIVLSALKKLDLRRVLPAAGDEGSCDKLSIVLSDKDGRDFFLFTIASGSESFSTACS